LPELLGITNLFIYLPEILGIMNRRPSFLQQYFCLCPEEDFGYLVVTEIIEGNPVASFTVKIPKAFCFLEGVNTYYAPCPN
jgi:hypothetical protein